MTLIQLWLTLLLAFADGKQCNVGTRITDWYTYWPAHQPVRVWSMKFDDGSASRWIEVFEDGTGEQYVFFYDPEAMPHGQCAVVLPDEMKVSIP